MKTALHWTGVFVAVAIAAYFAWFAWQNVGAHDLSALASTRVATAIFVAALVYSLTVPVSAVAWALLLRKQGESWRVPRLAAIMGVAQMGKYVPGNVFQIASRATLSMQQGMTLRAFTASVIHETVLVAAASVVMGSLYLMSASALGHLPAATHWLLPTAAAAAAVAVVVLAFGPTLLPGRLRESPWVVRVLGLVGPAPRGRATLLVLFAYCMNFLLIGLGIWSIALALGISASSSYALLTSAFSVAWLFGFVVPGAPAGVGVREGVLALLLGGAIPAHVLVTLILASRLATLGGDGLCFLAGLWGLHTRIGRAAP